MNARVTLILKSWLTVRLSVNVTELTLIMYCSVHGVQHMFFGEFFHQEIFVVNEIVIQCTKNLFSWQIIFITKPRITLPFNWFLIPRWGFYNFWHQVGCLPAFLNVIDVMTNTRCQNGAKNACNFECKKLIFWDFGSEPVFHWGSIGKNDKLTGNVCFVYQALLFLTESANIINMCWTSWTK